MFKIGLVTICLSCLFGCNREIEKSEGKKSKTSAVNAPDTVTLLVHDTIRVPVTSPDNGSDSPTQPPGGNSPPGDWTSAEFQKINIWWNRATVDCLAKTDTFEEIADLALSQGYPFSKLLSPLDIAQNALLRDQTKYMDALNERIMFCTQTGGTDCPLKYPMNEDFIMAGKIVDAFISDLRYKFKVGKDSKTWRESDFCTIVKSVNTKELAIATDVMAEKYFGKFNLKQPQGM
jgi:hypothetical protein